MERYGALWSLKTPTEGRHAIVTAAGRDAVDADALLTNSANADGKAVWSRCPGAGIKFPGSKLPGGDSGKKAGHWGERGISRKPLRGEGRSDSG